MMTQRSCFLRISALILWLSLPHRAPAAPDLPSLQQEVAQAIENFKKADPGLQRFFSTAAGYAVFPGVGKGGLVLGGAHGNGLAYEGGKLIGRASVTQVTFGAQIGGQRFAEIIFFETPAALARFKSSKLEMSAQLSAVAAAEGASKNAKYVDGVAVFTQAVKGLMAEASIGGQKLKFKDLAEPVKPQKKR
ncbi:MAG: hypothetical protein JNN07_01410 [Verrucomicrobiales bacterium]|nr:hypothetical protein [Verrucomicrobiales bacterium]